MPTIVRVGESEYHQFFADLSREAPDIMTTLGFSRKDLEEFLSDHEQLYDHIAGRVVEDGRSIALFDAIVNEQMDGLSVQYLLPTHWGDRYAQLSAACTALVEYFENDRAERVLFLRIAEEYPSMNAYFMGMLPSFGFGIDPRIVLSIPVADAIDLPTDSLLVLAPEETIREVAYSEDHLDDFVELFQLTDTRESEPQHRASERDHEMREAMKDEYARTSFTALLADDRLIGFCYGQVWDKELAIEELGVIPEYRRRGLGRFLVIRCIEKLIERYADHDARVTIGTDRTNTAALRLYESLGFRADVVESYATYYRRT